MTNIIEKVLDLVGVSSNPSLQPGSKIPDFSAKNQDGKEIKISDFRGKPVLIYFYPKDDTPGCTKEACSFRDEYSQFTKLGAVILGVSSQNSKSHQDFRAKHKLPFDLLTDSDNAIAKSLGVGSLMGFHKRESILVDPNGLVVRTYTSVDPDHHTQEVLEELKKLKK